MKSFSEFITEARAPRATNSPLHDLNDALPGIYSKDGWMKHGHGDEKLDKISHAAIGLLKGIKGPVHVYKAVPKGSQKNIKDGDMVTINHEYAKAHGAIIGKKHDIISKKVNTDELFSDGSSIHEFGYNSFRKQKK